MDFSQLMPDVCAININHEIEHW